MVMSFLLAQLDNELDLILPYNPYLYTIAQVNCLKKSKASAFSNELSIKEEPENKTNHLIGSLFIRAGDEIRTHDILLGKQAFYH
jgi:hypothetical protein